MRSVHSGELCKEIVIDLIVAPSVLSLPAPFRRPVGQRLPLIRARFSPHVILGYSYMLILWVRVSDANTINNPKPLDFPMLLLNALKDHVDLAEAILVFANLSRSGANLGALAVPVPLASWRHRLSHRPLDFH